MILNVKGLEKSFDDKAVLKGIDLELYRGQIVALIGSSGSGKSTLAEALKSHIEETYPNREVTLLDADIIRTHLSKGLGFSKEDRSMNVRRIGYVAHEIVKHGGIVIVANIADQIFEDSNLMLLIALVASLSKYFVIRQPDDQLEIYQYYQGLCHTLHY